MTRALLTAALLLLVPRAASADDGYHEPTVPDIIYAAADRYGVDGNRMACVAWYESRFDPQAYNWRDGSMGLFQWQPRTWAWASWNAGVGGSSPYEPYAAAESAAWLMSQPGGFRHWSVDWRCR